MRHHMGLHSVTTNLLKLLACTVGAVLAIGFVVVGAIAATVVATAVGTTRLASRALPGRATPAPASTVQPSTIVQLQPLTAYRTAA